MRPEGAIMKILFIGNSHTFMNDMPRLVSDMIAHMTGQDCQAVMLAYPGRSLKWHMEEEYFSERFNILHGGYDFCVIQEQAHPMTDEDSTVKNAAKIIELCAKAGTVPVIFETWAEKAMPEHQAEMTRRYRDLAKKTGALLAPIGEVWETVLKEHPEVDLYWKDGEHASPAGDYLISAVITKTITGSSPDAGYMDAYDFSGAGGFPSANEDVEEEHVLLPPQTVAVILDAVDKVMRDA